MKPNQLNIQSVNLVLPRLSDEFTAAFYYRTLSNWAKGEGFDLAASFFAKESEDELSHAKSLENYLVDWNVLVQLPNIAPAAPEFINLLDGIEKAYNMEYALLNSYELGANEALNLKDFATYRILMDKVETQTQAVAEYSDMLNILYGIDANDKYRMIKISEELFGE